MQVRDHADAAVMLDWLEITQFRNLTTQFQPSATLTLITGANASGKTTTLEAIHTVFTGRSFRTSRIDSLIQQNQPMFRIIGKYRKALGRSHTLGIERELHRTRMKLDGEAIKSLSSIAQELPIHTILPEVHVLLEQGPRFRRQFLDWGVFHVEHGYLETWQLYHRTLRQRNSLLRSKSPQKQIQAWDESLSQQAERLHSDRNDYMERLTPEFTRLSEELLDAPPTLKYLAGWDTQVPLKQQLVHDIATDIGRGFTQAGCHRADLQIRIDQRSVGNHYSRGQQKLLVCALRLAHLSVVNAMHGSGGLLLVDDLPAELDRQRRHRLLTALANANVQTFITATEPDLLDLTNWPEHKVFHVEHGKLHEVL